MHLKHFMLNQPLHMIVSISLSGYNYVLWTDDEVRPFIRKTFCNSIESSINNLLVVFCRNIQHAVESEIFIAKNGRTWLVTQVDYKS
jgi:hypothetical protein